MEWENEKITAFRSALIDWYEANKRVLPWRENTDPYRIWVSEIMLQQTKVDTVMPYFERFMTWFPTMQDFADAPEERILKAWEGLGYYSRVRNLQAAMKVVVAEHNGVVPSDLEGILALKGVGPYTAGAVLSIAYERAEPAVDGNVMRVISRVLEIDDDIMKQKTRKKFEAALYDLIDPEKPGEFNQGLMEIGALVCTPKKPMCLVCPLQEFCEAHQVGKEEEYPVKIKKNKSEESVPNKCDRANRERSICDRTAVGYRFTCESMAISDGRSVRKPGSDEACLFATIWFGTRTRRRASNARQTYFFTSGLGSRGFRSASDYRTTIRAKIKNGHKS
ncbi:A/G-specific adenine glycosylase [Listeria grandensis FSL F6-0971]|uniref:Adenine DNA glycosylase n=1 Tax=Listeria grandensis FSL F6-0971 TaxID=1265819 RepID=W7BH93_9LIST|nr:A/G-specific adenine glycosylase [Listeria grandensis FSL F6-0971]